MKRLVFDIEMVGEDWEKLDAITQKDLLKGLPDKKLRPAEYEEKFAELKDKLVFSPLTGKIIAIGVYDPDEKRGAVYYDAAGSNPTDVEEEGIKYSAMTEADMLTKFWGLAEVTQEFISFFGRRSDVPYMNIRSAVANIRPSKDLISNRYGSGSLPGAVHHDLADSLSFYGAAMYRGSLHRWCRAFGINSPKAKMDGSQVAEYYKAGKYLDIAKYNLADLYATAQLYDYWNRYLKF